MGVYDWITYLNPNRFRGFTRPSVERISGCPSLGVKQSGHETDFSRQASAEVSTEWNYTITPPTLRVCLRGVHIDSFVALSFLGIIETCFQLRVKYLCVVHNRKLLPHYARHKGVQETRR